MIEIIARTPLFVWPLLAYLIWGGLRARKTYIVSWKALAIMPAVMFVWSIYAMIVRYEPMALCLWAASITIGILLGTLMVRKLDLRFDKKRSLIEVSGSWTPLFLSVSIFCLRYSLGVAYGMHPELSGTPLLLGVESVASIVSGIFLGRLIGYWQRSKAAQHDDLLSN